MQDIYGRVGKVHTQAITTNMYLMHLTPDLKKGGSFMKKVENENKKDCMKAAPNGSCQHFLCMLLTGLFLSVCQYGSICGFRAG